MLKEHSKSDIYQYTIGDDMLLIGEYGIPHYHVTGRNNAK